MRTVRLIGLSLLVFAAAFAQPARPQAQDEEFARLVKEWTTRPEFMSPLVDHLPKAAGVPSPKDVLGYYIGAPKKLTHVADINRYYRALAAASPRVKIFSAGTTDEGRECLVAAIADEDTIRNLDTYKGYLARLADPRGLSEADAKSIIAQAKPIYMFTGGLHSSETGPPEMLMELAYRLAVEDSPLFDQIRKNVIVMVINAADPDGRDRYVDWYYRHLTAQENEQDRIPGPPYWGKYIFHDNNRDINYSQVTMRNWLKFYLEWHPPIMHDLHESEPLLYTFSGQAPQNPTLDPILYGELPWFAEFRNDQDDRLRHAGRVDARVRGYVVAGLSGVHVVEPQRHAAHVRDVRQRRRQYHEAHADAAEAAGGRGGGGRGGAMTDARMVPAAAAAARGGVVHAQQHQLHGDRRAFGAGTDRQIPPDRAREFLREEPQLDRNRARPKRPSATCCRPASADMTRVAFIVNILRLQGIEVGRATAEVKLKDGTFPAGSLIVKRNQPYGRLAKILLEKQKYPDPNLRTYDDTGWTMGLMSQADVREIADKAVLDVPVAAGGYARNCRHGEGRRTAASAVLDNGANSLATLRYRLKDVKFDAIEQAGQGGRQRPAGGVAAGAIEPARATGKSKSWACRRWPWRRRRMCPSTPSTLPRLAVFSTWGSTQDVGWVRYALRPFRGGVRFDLQGARRARAICATLTT